MPKKPSWLSSMSEEIDVGCRRDRADPSRDCCESKLEKAAEKQIKARGNRQKGPKE